MVRKCFANDIWALDVCFVLRWAISTRRQDVVGAVQKVSSTSQVCLADRTRQCDILCVGILEQDIEFIY